MGEIVAAAVVSHQPAIMAPKEARLMLGQGKDTTLIEGFAPMRAALAKAGADTLVIFDTHWMTTVQHAVAGAPRFSGLYTSDEMPTVICDLPYSYEGAPKLAAEIAEAGEAAGVPVANVLSENLPRHYPTINVLHHLQAPMKVLSVGTCQTAEPHNFLDLGRVIATAVARVDAKVALLASGGMSHTFWPLDIIMQNAAFSPDFVRTPEARTFDDRILGLWARGDHASVLGMVDAYKTLNPEGGFGHYLTMLGALGGAACKARGTPMSAYENAVGTGQVHMWFDLAA